MKRILLVSYLAKSVEVMLPLDPLVASEDVEAHVNWCTGGVRGRRLSDQLWIGPPREEEEARVAAVGRRRRRDARAASLSLPLPLSLYRHYTH